MLVASVLIASWLIAVPVPFMLMWGPSWNCIPAHNVLLGITCRQSDHAHRMRPRLFVERRAEAPGVTRSRVNILTNHFEELGFSGDNDSPRRRSLGAWSEPVPPLL